MILLRTSLIAASALLFAGAAVAAPAAAPGAKPTGAKPLSAKPAKPKPPAKPAGPMTLVLQGLDKITGKPTTLLVPIGKSVQFATLTISARYCYSTPVNETPETAAFVQIDDHRPDQPQRQIGRAHV